MQRTAIAQIAKIIGRELDTGVGPSGEALAAGPILADAGATSEIIVKACRTSTVGPIERRRISLIPTIRGVEIGWDRLEARLAGKCKQ